MQLRRVREVLRISAKRLSSVDALGVRDWGIAVRMFGWERRRAVHGMRRKGEVVSTSRVMIYIDVWVWRGGG